MTVLLSTAYFPPIEYMALIAQNESVTIEVCENYSKQSYRNRCKILNSTAVQDLSIPVIKTEGNHTPVSRIQISYAENWQRTHWRSIETAYNNSPFFLYYRDELEVFFTKKYDTLLELNTDILVCVIRLLGIKTILNFSENYEKNGNFEDYRDLIHPKKDKLFSMPQAYIQTFSENKFIPNLSILDLLFNCGNESKSILLQMKK